MDSYSPAFKEAQSRAKETDYSKIFPSFHKHPELFHFIMAPEYQQTNDTNALLQAWHLNGPVFRALWDKGPSKLGEGSEEIDGVESRHIFVLTDLITNFGKDWKDVVEIGGGYGNYIRLIQDIVAYDSWTIIDLDYITELQKWFIENTKTVDMSNVNFVVNTELEKQENLNPFLVLGVHSLSEISMAEFEQYLPLINRAEWFYYVRQLFNPSEELLLKKQELILANFSIENETWYEGGASIAYLFKNQHRGA